MISQSDTLTLDLKNGLLIISLNRPAQSNALNGELVDALVDVFTRLGERDDIRVVILRAEGKNFCAGLDMRDGDFVPEERNVEALWRVPRRIARIYQAMRRCPQPIISLVQGAACGGGFSLALASDVRILANTARMNAAYIKIGLTGCDMGSSYFLPRLVGVSLASELLLTGNFITAQRSLAVGLASDVVAEDALTEVGLRLAQDMLNNTPMGLRLTKEALNYSVDAASLEAVMAMEDRHQSLLSLTEDASEAVEAFLQKRAPKYRDL